MGPIAIGSMKVQVLSGHKNIQLPLYYTYL